MTRRAGTMTMGISLVAAGTLALVHLFFPELLNYYFIMRLWPLVLIGLGTEVILSCTVFSKGQRMRYDGWAVLILICMLSIAALMAGVEMSLNYNVSHVLP